MSDPTPAERTPRPPITVRLSTDDDLPFMWEMLYLAAFVDEATRESWRKMASSPLAKYLEGWGRVGDAGVVAVGDDGAPVGAAWYRLFAPDKRGEGILALPGTPELSIAIVEGHRGRGIGREMLLALIRLAREASFAQMLLSVDPANVKAIRLYERVGFRYAYEGDPHAGTSLMMLLEL